VDELIKKAKILIESLPYIKRFYGKTIVIKYGGHAMIDNELKESFALDIILLKYIGINPVVVHGGGPQIGVMLERLGIKTSFVDGFRITDQETMDVVEMVLVGKVNKEIVGLINTHGGIAVGLSGKDGRLIMGRKMNIVKAMEKDQPPEIIDTGKLGEVEQINPGVLKGLQGQGFIPVIAPVGVGENGETYNINADLVAGSLAAAMNAAKLILLTDVPGVCDKDNNLISSLTSEQALSYIDNKIIIGGMIPKVKCCIDAVSKGVKKAHIINGTLAHAVLLEIFTESGVGTEFEL